jgi:endonuclease/exonuclease/phosphatase family metal-dependent hydrolase
MSWNIQFGQGTDAVENFDRTSSWIASFNPDIVGLCEVPAGSVPTIVALVTAKTGRVWFPHFVPKYVGTDEGNLILSRHSFVGVNARFLSADRSVAEATINVGGQNINFFATHLDDAASSNRVVEVGQLKDFASGFSGVRIFTGDFNGGPDTSEALSMLDSYADAWTDAMNRGTASAYPDNPVGTQTRTRRGRIDYVFYSRNSALTSNAARIPDSRDLNNTNVAIRLGTLDDKGVRPSDHNAVIADFDLNVDGVTPTPTPTPTPQPTATPTPAPTATPVAPALLIDSVTGRGVAMNSTLLTRDPFQLQSPFNLGTDKRTRITLFSTNVILFSGETASAVTAKAINSAGGVFDMPVEYVGRVPGYDWLWEVKVRLPQDSSLQGNISVNISLHGVSSNTVTLKIAPP